MKKKTNFATLNFNLMVFIANGKIKNFEPNSRILRRHYSILLMQVVFFARNVKSNVHLSSSLFI